MGKKRVPSLLRVRGDIENAINAWKSLADGDITLSVDIAWDASRAGERLNAFLDAVEKERELLAMALQACQGMAKLDVDPTPGAIEVSHLVNSVLKLANEPL